MKNSYYSPFYFLLFSFNKNIVAFYQMECLLLDWSNSYFSLKILPCTVSFFILHIRKVQYFLWLWNVLSTLPKRCHCCSVAQACLTLCDPMGHNLPGSSVHGIIQGRILEQVSISSSGGSSRPRDWTHVSCIPCIVRQILYHWATWEALGNIYS